MNDVLQLLTIKNKWGAIHKVHHPIFFPIFLHPLPQFLQSLVHTTSLAIFGKNFDPYRGSHLWMVPRLCNTKVHRKDEKHGLPDCFRSVSIFKYNLIFIFRHYWVKLDILSFLLNFLLGSTLFLYWNSSKWAYFLKPSFPCHIVIFWGAGR